MLKPVGARCNLRCSYCYYLEKLALSVPSVKSSAFNVQRPTPNVPLLEEFTRQYIEAQTMPQVLFTWHGGEPLLLPLSFYRRALELQRRYARGRQVDNSLQTNGLLLDDEWCEFLAENHFLVGLSVDGPAFLHDRYRRDRAGRPTFDRVMRAARLLEKHGVEWNAMAVVTSFTAEHPREFYQFFRDMGCQYLQFTPVVERTCSRSDGLQLAAGTTPGGQLTPESVAPQAWGDFLCAVYDEWVCHDVGHLFVQLFDATLANWVGEPPGLCAMSPNCGQASVMECNGDVYSCDHFVFPEYRLGNIFQQPLLSLLYGERQQQFAAAKTGTLPRQCRECRYLRLCYGECPRNRFARDSYGQPGLNYLCHGYRQFFAHVAPDMDFMARELAAGRPPANIMSR